MMYVAGVVAGTFSWVASPLVPPLVSVRDEGRLAETVAACTHRSACAGGMSGAPPRLVSTHAHDGERDYHVVIGATNAGAGSSAVVETRPAPQRRQPALDGVRACAVLAVFGVHVGLIPWGAFGVEVISTIFLASLIASACAPTA